MTTHKDHIFSVTIHTDDLAVVNCLRALSKYSQKSGNNNIPWGGTKDKDWERDDHQVTFHFSSEAYRHGFVSELERILPDQTWNLVSLSDNDPATPQK